MNYLIVGGLDAPEASQVNAALGNWTLHNTHLFNCSEVTFNPVVSASYTVVTFDGQSGAFPGAAAVTNSATVSGHVVSATTTFYWGAVFAGTNIHVWNRDGSPDYYRDILGTMLHESGHTMGFGEVNAPQTRGGSVMNHAVGINDSEHFQPTEVQDCDDIKIDSETQYLNNCLIAGGGGGDLPCIDYWAGDSYCGQAATLPTTRAADARHSTTLTVKTAAAVMVVPQS